MWSGALPAIGAVQGHPGRGREGGREGGREKGREEGVREEVC